MDKSSATDYVYAKSQGMLAKSFVGPRKINLFTAKTLSDLWRLLFDTAVPLIPENMLAKAIEEEAEKAFIDDYITLLSSYDEPDSIAVHLLRFYDYQNIKEINSAILKGHANLPKLADIGMYSQLDYAAWPKVNAITKHSDFSWLDTVPTRETQKDVDSRLDIQYTKILWSSVKKIPANSRLSVEKLIKEHIILQNILWAIRLKTYYGFTYDQIVEQLVFNDDSHPHSDILAGPALTAMDKNADTWDDWADWKYVDLLNPNDEGSVWHIDPTWLQNAINVYLNKMAYKAFRRGASSAHILTTWFKIKEYELNCIRTCVEGLRLNVDTEQLKHFIW